MNKLGMTHIYEGSVIITTYSLIPWMLYFSLNEIMSPNGKTVGGIVLMHITPFFCFGVTIPEFILDWHRRISEAIT